MTDTPILSVEGLKKSFPIRKGLLRRQVGEVKAVDDVTFHVMPGETLALVGESGCGKTTVSRCVMRAQTPSAGRIAVRFSTDATPTDIAFLPKRALRPFRRHMQMVFQDPFSSLNPRMTVGDIIAEPLLVNGVGTAASRLERVRELLALVQLPLQAIGRFPHAFSGGQRQRVGIARALALNPLLIVADEPVSALDVSVQAQIVNLLLDLQDRLSLSYLFVAHDLSIVKHMSHRVAVMYLGRIVELADRETLFRAPAHPYTRALLDAVPQIEGGPRRGATLAGDLPSPYAPPPGCAFHTRCPLATARCAQEAPALRTLAPGQQVACHLAGAGA